MSAEFIVLDPPGVSDATRQELDITPWVSAQAGINFGDAAISAYMADATIGSSPVDFRIPNRTITIPLNLRDVGTTTFEDIRARVQAKAGLFQRDGGWLERQINGVSLYADVVNATLHLGGSWLQTYRDVDIDAVLTLECLPEFYGDEVTLDSIAATGSLTAVLEQTSLPAFISGDHPGRTRIAVTDTSGHDQLGVLWGIRSRYYDSATTAALSYEAETLGPLDAAGTASHSGASGSAVMKHAALPADAWCPVMSTNIGGTAALTHRGSYRVWGRFYSGSAIPQARFVWGVADVAHPVTNDPVRLPSAGNFHVLDLGSIRLDPPPVGAMQWHGVLQAKADTQDDQIEVDKLWFQPLDESAGKLIAVQQDSSLGISVIDSATSYADNSGVGTVAWTAAGTYGLVDVSTSAITHYLKGTGLGFAIPAGATIAGIKVTVVRDVALVGGTSPGTTVKDYRLRLIKTGAIQTPDKADTITPWVLNGGVNAYYGGPTDLWSGTWTPSDINNSGFGVAIAANVNPGPVDTARLVVAFRVTVYYTTSGGFTVTQDAVIHASQTAELRTEGIYREDSAGTVYGKVAEVIGDLPRLPPSGLEESTVELFVKPSRGNLDTDPDPALDAFTAQVKYRPTFLFVDGF